MKKLAIEYDCHQISEDLVTLLSNHLERRNQPQGDPLMKFIAAIATLAFAIFTTGPAAAESALDENELVTKAHYTVERMAKDKDVGPNVRSLIKRAKAVMIFPHVLKGAFFFGAEGGNGVLVAKNASGNWGYPAFYTMGSASFGLQFGGQSQEMVLLIMSERGLSSVLNNEVKLGADISAAAGPVGVGAEASTTTNLRADIYSFSMNQGAFLGASVEGAVIHPRKAKNHAYYGNPKTTAEAIVIRGRYQNAHADPLRGSLRKLQ
jgi:SH3 domain-containing YSC84-like protein 1